MVSEIDECSIKRKKCAKKCGTGNIPAIKTVNITQVTNVVVATVNQPTNNGKVVIQYIKEEVVDTTDVNRFMKEKVTRVEKCVTKKKHVGKSVDNKGKQKCVANTRVSNQVTEEWVMGAKQYSWKSHIRNAKTSATNVMVSTYLNLIYCVIFQRVYNIQCCEIDIYATFSKNNSKNMPQNKLN